MRAYTVNPKEYNKRMIEKYCYSYMICKEEFAQEQSKAVEEYQNFADFEMG
jgi:transposase